MSSFDITPSGVRTVLTNVSTQAEELETGFDTAAIEGHVSGLLGVPAPGVAQALAEHFELEQPSIESMFRRITASVLGAANVTAAYGTASDQMLSETQTRAIDAAATGDFSGLDTGQ